MSTKCNRENMEKFCSALESGEYKQSRGRLRVAGGGGYSYCCLGVATDLAIRDGVRADWSRADLSHLVQQWLGLNKADPLLRDHGNRKIYATNANDSFRMTFPEIAKLFRQTYLEENDE